MATQKAIQMQGPGEAKLVHDAPVPRLRDDYILVRTRAVALNPTDWKHIDFMATPGAIVGCDYAGVVEEIGKDVGGGLKKGDRVCGVVHGSNKVCPEDGAFAQHVTAKGGLAMKMPERLSFQDAATLGVGITTVGQALYQSLGFPLPTEPAKEKTSILIYGGSTATGTLAIQFAKLSGLEVVTTCSKHNFDLVKSLGADHVFDYSSPTVAADIRKATNDGLQYALDNISEGPTPTICCEAISSKGGHYSALGRIEKLPREDVTNRYTAAYTAIGEAFILRGMDIPAKPEDYEFAVKFCNLTQELLAAGKLKPHPLELRKGGLEGTLQGLDDLRQKRVSGVKLVYLVD